MTRPELQAEWGRLERSYHAVRRDWRPLAACFAFWAVGGLALLAFFGLATLGSESLNELAIIFLGPLIALIPLGVVGAPVGLILFIRDRSRVEQRRMEIQQAMARIAGRMAELEELQQGR